MTARLTALLCLLACTTLMQSTAQAADNGGCTIESSLHSTTEICEISGANHLPVSTASGDGHTYTLELACAHLQDVGCAQARTCTVNGNAGAWYTVFRDGVAYARVCLTHEQAISLSAITPALVLNAMRRLDWPTPELTIQPPGGKTLVNLETVFFTTLDQPQTATVTLLGQSVSITATPVRFIWHADDGVQPWQTSGPGQPWHNGADINQLNHAIYTHADVTVHPWVDVVYAGRYRVAGGPWRDIPETLTLPGPRQTLEVLEATPLLVAPDQQDSG